MVLIISLRQTTVVCDTSEAQLEGTDDITVNVPLRFVTLVNANVWEA